MDHTQLLEKIIPSAIVAFFVSVVWAAVHEGSKARRAFIVSTANELKPLLSDATRDGRAFWLSSSPDRSKERLELVAQQAEIVGLISLLEKFEYNPGTNREDFCDALTGGNFDIDGHSDPTAAAKLNGTAIELRVSVDDFVIQTVKRPILRFFTTPFRVSRRWWNKFLN